CPYCSKVFCSFQALRGHIDGLHLNKKSYRCYDCGDSFKWRTDLCKHRRNLCPYRIQLCQNCSAVFTQMKSLKEHVDGVHLQKKSFHCVDCGEAFKWRACLSKHRRLESGCQINKWQCNLCTSIYSSERVLREHIKAIHLHKMLCHCKECGQSFKWRHQLQKHKLI
ncbi:hypothetical protein HELRODRAFT_135774, partial [Helobdella robusta]|uniref:C2H2-type domain-containing protein n=1 Tax=Helobdella robusta TaxID=6412 RepID=T1EIA6_HELRO